MTTIGGIKNFTQAIGTGGNIGQHERGLVAAGLAGTDFKLLITDGIKPRSFEALDKTARRFIGFEPEKKLFECGARTFDFDKDALRRIIDPTRQFEFGSDCGTATCPCSRKKTHAEEQGKKQLQTRRSGQKIIIGRSGLQ